MKKLILPLCAIVALTAGCSAAHTIKDDAKETPIGSVFTGETNSADSYIQKVSEQNRKLDRDTWRPKNKDRFYQ